PTAPPIGSSCDFRQEVRFAVVMYGGVSLAIYINGIAQELLRMVRATAQDPAQPGRIDAGGSPSSPRLGEEGRGEESLQAIRRLRAHTKSTAVTPRTMASAPARRRLSFSGDLSAAASSEMSTASPATLPHSPVTGLSS